ncbi:MAG TPA: AMP-dependent synthetase [Deltaproteobacteria bacterium]|nr:AMP-dependent synthetase [Deltaproteobacteria bacterium]HCP48136.1 AMP-dependent synthetase [Deltaproteobacteria bacterium]
MSTHSNSSTKTAPTNPLTEGSLVQLGVPQEEASDFLRRLVLCLDETDGAEEAWSRLSRTMLDSSLPHTVHRALFDWIYRERSTQEPPAPAWIPTNAETAASNLGPLLEAREYDQLHRWSVEEPEAYWSVVLRALKIQAPVEPSCILDVTDGPAKARWLPGMHLNIAESCFVNRDPAEAAIIWQADDGPLQTVSRSELRSRSEHVARVLAARGLGPGHAIAIAMPMTVESVVIYLGIVLSGATAVGIADSFAAEEIATRMRISKASAVFTQDVILRGGRTLPLYQRLVEAEAPLAIVTSASDTLAVDLRPTDSSWSEFLASTPLSNAPYLPARVPAETATNILFSSGTTGEPKAIPWTHITPIKAAADGWAHHDIRPGDVVAWPTNLGWMMGPWLIYAALLNDAAIALFQGAPTGVAFARFVQDARVTMLGVVPSLVRAWRSQRCLQGLDWSSIRCFSSTGEASNADDSLWLMSQAGYKPIIEYCGGTEIGGGYICGSMVQSQAPSTFSTPALGCDLVILDDEGQRTQNGELALVAPMLGSSNRLLNRDHDEVYFNAMPRGPEGQVLRRHGDQMEQLPGGYFRAHGRADDTMNLGGIKTSSKEIERLCDELPTVRETAAIAVAPQGGGPGQLVLFMVLEDDQESAVTELKQAAQQAIRGRLNPLFKVHDVVIMDSLPRTASNKVMRRVLRADYSP